MKNIISLINTSVAAFWRRVEKSCSNDARSLSVYRILWALFVSTLSMPYLSWVGEAPQGLFYPPLISVASLFQSFPPKWVFTTVDLALLFSIVFIGLGIKARFCALFASVIYLSASAFMYSFGKIDHGILFWATLICLSQSNWSTHYALLRDKPVSKQRNNRALAVAGVLIGFAMFTAGFEKMIRWIDFDTSTSGFLDWFYGGYYLGREFLAAPVILSLREDFFEFVDYSAVVFELTPLLCLISGQKWWTSWLFAACLFHFSNTLFLNIPFTTHIPVYLMFVPIWKLFALGNVGRLFLTKWNIFISFAIIGLFCFVHLLQRSFGLEPRFLFITSDETQRMWQLWVAAGLWFFAAIVMATWRMKILSPNKLMPISSFSATAQKGDGEVTAFTKKNVK